MTTKVTLYRIVHIFNQKGKLKVPHLYKAQCKVLFFWHNIGTAKDEVTATQELLIHEHLTKKKTFFQRLTEVWITKFKK